MALTDQQRNSANSAYTPFADGVTRGTADYETKVGGQSQQSFVVGAESSSADYWDYQAEWGYVHLNEWIQDKTSLTTTAGNATTTQNGVTGSAATVSYGNEAHDTRRSPPPAASRAVSASSLNERQRQEAETQRNLTASYANLRLGITGIPNT